MARKSKLTLEQIQTQIVALQEQADTLRKREAQEVLSRIKEAIAHYGFSPVELGFRAATSPSAPRQASTKGNARKSRSKGVIRFRDAHGHTWTGVGKRPNWYKEAIAAGQSPEDLAVN